LTTSKRWALAVLAAFTLAVVGLCVSVSPSIFPVTPPVEFQQVQVGMPLEEVLAVLFSQEPNFNDKEDGKGGPVWVHWYVRDGVIQVRLDENGFVDFVNFQASRSSLIEEISEIVDLIRRIR